VLPISNHKRTTECKKKSEVNSFLAVYTREALLVVLKRVHFINKKQSMHISTSAVGNKK
jgi:hypothetical protein